MKKTTSLIALIFAISNFMYAQPTAGLPPTFFVDGSVSPLLSHVQSGNPADLGNFGSQWIGIGQPSAGPVVVDAYGIRTQWNNNAGLLALTGTGSNKKLELNWGGPGKTANFEINNITSFTNPNGKVNHLTIRPDGRVGMGTTAPIYKLQANGDIYANGGWFRVSGTRGLYFQSYGGGFRMVDNTWIRTFGNKSFYHNTGIMRTDGTFQVGSNGNRFIVNTNGIGINSTNPQFNLEVLGNIVAIDYFIFSDKRYKENIKTIESAIDKVNALNGVTYNFKEGEINERDFKAAKSAKQIGFIAQNVEEVLPELVHTDKRGYRSVNYTAIIPVLVEGMKEQQEVITEQEETILQQEEQLTDLQLRVERLEALLLNGNSSESQGNTPVQSNRIDYSGIVLKQNAPNPFKDVTTINYELPSDLQDAQLVIYDLNGRIISKYNVIGTGSVDFNSAGLTNGTYAYAIVVDGQSVATNKMLIQK